jgi:hypothetical protein
MLPENNIEKLDLNILLHTLGSKLILNLYHLASSVEGATNIAKKFQSCILFFFVDNIKVVYFIQYFTILYLDF